MTNLEKMQSLTSEEMAKFISFVEAVGAPCSRFGKTYCIEETFYCQCFGDCFCSCLGDKCDSCKRKWLESEVDTSPDFWSLLFSNYEDIMHSMHETVRR